MKERRKKDIGKDKTQQGVGRGDDSGFSGVDVDDESEDAISRFPSCKPLTELELGAVLEVMVLEIIATGFLESTKRPPPY